MRIFLLILSFFWLAATVAAKDVYRFVDEDGNVIYSDTPVPGAEKIGVGEVQTITPGAVPKFQYTPPPAKDVAAYTKLEIVSPEDGSVIQRNGEGVVTVSGIVEPVLNIKAGHYLVLYLDGTEAASGTNPQFTLNGMERGTHTVNLAVVDQSGSQVISSPAVSFTIFQQSVPRPKPK